MSGSIRLRFERDDDGTGELSATAAANGFAGVGAAWFNVDELQNFASRLSDYPLSDPGPTIAGGFYRDGARPALSQELIGISAYAVGRTGQVGVQVRLATGVWEATRPESRHSVQLELLTTYEHLGRFARQLAAVVVGEAPEAVLEGEKLE